MRLFKKKDSLLTIAEKAFNEVVAVEESPFEGKTEKELIEEIHETFFTEVDRLLAEAKILHSTHTDKQSEMDKASSLMELGFTSSKSVLEGNKEADRLSNLELENVAKNQLKKAIGYFSVKYPQSKFITEESVKKICEKYNLVYGDVNHYEGNVPDKNLTHIKEFKIKDEDACYQQQYRHWGRSDSKPMYIDKYEFDIRTRDTFMPPLSGNFYSKSSLEIAAPRKDFSDKLEVEGFEIKEKIEIPDPVVLQPVLFEGRKHYLIVTAWGAEAEDELVVNQINN